MSYTWWIQNRIGQTSSGPGAYWVGNTTSNRTNENKAAMPYTPGSAGWSKTVSNTGNLVSKTYGDGVSRQSWDLNQSWTAGTGAGTYTPTTTGCQNFTTGPSGRFAITYSNVPAITAADCVTS